MFDPAGVADGIVGMLHEQVRQLLCALQGRRRGAGRGLAPYGPRICIEHLNFD